LDDTVKRAVAIYWERVGLVIKFVKQACQPNRIGGLAIIKGLVIKLVKQACQPRTIGVPTIIVGLVIKLVKQACQPKEMGVPAVSTGLVIKLVKQACHPSERGVPAVIEGLVIKLIRQACHAVVFFLRDCQIKNPPTPTTTKIATGATQLLLPPVTTYPFGVFGVYGTRLVFFCSAIKLSLN
jgi:hypothetical protein